MTSEPGLVAATVVVFALVARPSWRRLVPRSVLGRAVTRPVPGRARESNAEPVGVTVPEPLAAVVAIGVGAGSGLVSGSASAAVGWLLLGVSGALLARPLVRRHRDGRRRETLERALPGLIESVSRSCRSGAGVTQALVEMAETAPPRLASDLRPLSTALVAGRPAPEALTDWVGSSGVDGGRMLAAVVSVAVPLGGGVADALDQAAETVRVRAALERELGALTSQARTSAAVLAAVPLVFGAGLLFASGEARGFMFGHPTGPLILGAGLVLDVVGLTWMRLLALSTR